MSRWIHIAGYLVLAFSLLEVISGWKHTDLSTTVPWAIVCLAVLKGMGTSPASADREDVCHDSSYGIVLSHIFTAEHQVERLVPFFNLGGPFTPVLPPVYVPKLVPSKWEFRVMDNDGKYRTVSVTEYTYRTVRDGDKFKLR